MTISPAGGPVIAARHPVLKPAAGRVALLTGPGPDLKQPPALGWFR